jgi:hypothetical protein
VTTTPTLAPLAELSAEQLRSVRGYCNAPQHLPVVVLEGSASPPAQRGEPAGDFTPDGKRVSNARSYQRAGGRLVFRPSSQHVQVGLGWLRAQGMVL